jgi:hypothetical protein
VTTYPADRNEFVMDIGIVPAEPAERDEGARSR